MGQCYVKLKAVVRRLKEAARRRMRRGGGRQYRHKRYDYTPKRAWKYNDDQVMNQISLRGTEYDSPVWELTERGEGGAGGATGEIRETVLLNPMIDEDSEEEGEQVGETQSGGRLVFAEMEEEEDEPVEVPTMPPHDNSSPCHRSSSNSSLKIGRFEVCEVSGGGGEGREVEEEGEGGEEGEVMVEADISEMDTTHLLDND